MYNCIHNLIQFIMLPAVFFFYETQTISVVSSPTIYWINGSFSLPMPKNEHENQQHIVINDDELLLLWDVWLWWELDAALHLLKRLNVGCWLAGLCTQLPATAAQFLFFFFTFSFCTIFFQVFPSSPPMLGGNWINGRCK